MTRSIDWTTRDILLLCEYSNYAWVRTHKGWYVTPTGEIRTFALNHSMPNGYEDQTAGSISMQDVGEIQSLLEAAALWQWNECHAACDMGTYEAVGFIPPIAQRSPTSIEVPLLKHGDVEGKNGTQAAQELLKLIDRIKPDSIEHWHGLTDDL